MQLIWNNAAETSPSPHHNKTDHLLLKYAVAYADELSVHAEGF